MFLFNLSRIIIIFTKLYNSNTHILKFKNKHHKGEWVLNYVSFEIAYTQFPKNEMQFKLYRMIATNKIFTFQRILVTVLICILSYQLKLAYYYK